MLVRPACRACSFLWAPLAWLLALSALGAPADRNPFEGRTIRRLDIFADGPVRRISPEDLLKLIPLQEGRPFQAAAARYAIVQLHATDLFSDIHVQPSEAPPDGVNVTIHLFRKFFIEQIDFSGQLHLTERELRRELTVREGEPLVQTSVETSTTQLVKLYQRSGFNQATVTPRFERFSERARVRIHYAIEAGPQTTIRTLDFDGEGGLDTAPIAQQVRLKPGDGYSDQELDAAIERVEAYLALQGYFQAEVYLRNGIRYEAASDTVALTFRIVPHERTDVVISGVTLPPEEWAALPLFRQRVLGDVTIRDSEATLINRFQDEGYLMAQARIRVSPAAEAQPSRVEITVDPGEKMRVRALRFEGCAPLPPADLLPRMAVRPRGFFGRGTFSNELLEADADRLKMIFQQQGFPEVRVQPRVAVEGTELTVTYVIETGPRVTVRHLAVVGNTAIPTAELRAQLHLREGEPFSLYAVGADRSSLVASYENFGYRQVDCRSEVLPVDEQADEQAVDITYTITEGPQSLVDDVIVTGNLATRRSVIDREILLEANRPFSYDASLKSESNLYNLAVFNRVKSQELASFAGPSRKLVLFQLEEARKYTLLYGLGYSHSFGASSTEGLRGTLGVTNNNFRGAARTLSLNLRAGAQRQRGNLSYTLPRVLGRKLPTVVSLTADNENRVTGESQSSFRLRGRPYDSFRISASAQSERTLSRRESLFFRYNFEQVRLNVPENLEQPLQFFREEARLLLSSLSTSYLNESRDDPLDPHRGSFWSSDLTWASSWLGSERNFLRFQIQAQHYLPLSAVGPEVTLATSLRLGVISSYGARPVEIVNPVPISERFFAGGPTTLRGMPLDLAGPILRDRNTGQPILVPKGNERVPVPIGGNLMLIGNAELRFPLFSIVGGTLFYDVGNVYERLSDFGNGGTVHDFGFGLSLRTPVGPVRLDIAVNPNPPDLEGFQQWNVHINLGHPF